MADKLHWTGKFNINNEDWEVSADAFTEEQAKEYMIWKIAAAKKVLPRVISGWLKNHPLSFEIKTEIRKDHPFRAGLSKN
jgi:hypothetical protein